jgi:hypothetical protein
VALRPRDPVRSEDRTHAPRCDPRIAIAAGAPHSYDRRVMSAVLRVSFVVGAASLPCIAGCNILFSLDGYQGPPAVAAATDGGVDVSDVPSDADLAGDTVPGADGMSFCPPGAILCDDFDRDSGDVRGPWGMVLQNGGTIAIAGVAPRGGVLDCVVPGSDAGAEVDVSKTTGTTIVSTITLRSAVRVVTAPSMGGVHANKLALSDADSGVTSFVFPYFSSYGLTVGELICNYGLTPPCAFAQSSPVTPTAGDWHDVSLTVDFTASPASFTLLLDGTRAIEATSQKGAAGGVLTVLGGATAVDGPHGDLELQIDELVVTGN